MTLSQRRPLALTKWPRLERTGSRYIPRAAIRAPQRRSMLSSTPITTGPFGTKAATSSNRRRCASAREHQCPWLSTRWYTAKPATSPKPMTRSAAATVRRPGASSAPHTSTSAWRQTATVNWPWNGRIQPSSTAGTTLDVMAHRLRPGTRTCYNTAGSAGVKRHGRQPRGDARSHRSLSVAAAARWRRGGVGEQGLHPLQPAHRRTRRPAASNRSGRQGSGLVVAARRLGRSRPFRSGGHAARGRPRVHRQRGLLLDPRLMTPASRHVQTQDQAEPFFMTPAGTYALGVAIAAACITMASPAWSVLAHPRCWSGLVGRHRRSA